MGLVGSGWVPVCSFTALDPLKNLSIFLLYDRKSCNSCSLFPFFWQRNSCGFISMVRASMSFIYVLVKLIQNSPWVQKYPRRHIKFCNNDQHLKIKQIIRTTKLVRLKSQCYSGHFFKLFLKYILLFQAKMAWLFQSAEYSDNNSYVWNNW